MRVYACACCARACAYVQVRVRLRMLVRVRLVDLLVLWVSLLFIFFYLVVGEAITY